MTFSLLLFHSVVQNKIDPYHVGKQLDNKVKMTVIYHHNNLLAYLPDTSTL